MVDKLNKQRTKQKEKKLYVAFVDLKTVFDKINRELNNRKTEEDRKNVR